MTHSIRTFGRVARVALFALLPLALTAQTRPVEPQGGAGAPAAPAPDLHLPPGAEKAAEAIDRDTIDAGIRTLADDKIEGRAPATKGDELARAYLQESLKNLGYQPGAPEGGWQQPVELVGVLSRMPKSWTFQAGEKPLSLAWSEDYIAASGVQQETTTIEDAEVVFVGYGIQAPEYGWDDYKGANLKGKILLMLNNDPDWDPTLFAGERRLYYGRWTYKYESGARQGAAGVLIIHTTPSAGYPWQVVQSSWGGKQFRLPAGAEPTIELAGWASEAAASRLVEASGQSLVPALYLSSGTDVIGKPPGWGAAQLEAWTLTHYHQPNDEYDPNWNLGAMIEDARLGFLAGLSIAETPALPTWNPGDEFEAARKMALGLTP